MPSMQEMRQDCLGTSQKPHAHNQKCKKSVKQPAQFYKNWYQREVHFTSYQIHLTFSPLSMRFRGHSRHATHYTYSKDQLKRLFLALPLLEALNNRGKYRRLQLLNSESSVLIKKASPEMPTFSRLERAPININHRQTKPKFPTWNQLFTHSKKELFIL